MSKKVVGQLAFGSNYVFAKSRADQSDEELSLSLSDSSSEDEAEHRNRKSSKAAEASDGTTAAAGPSSSSGFMSRLRSVFSSSSTRKSVGEREKEREKGKSHRRKWVKKADTNIINVPMDGLVDREVIQTGECHVCDGCRAVMSNMSRISRASASAQQQTEEQAQKQEEQDEEEEGEFVWVCEFCSKENRVEMHPRERPEVPEMVYIREGPKELLDGKGSANIVFAMDISGSMSLSSQIKGTVRKTRAQRALEEQLRAFGDNSDQRMKGDRPGYSYVSRLQCLQGAIDQELEKLALSAGQSARVALVSFCDTVRIFSGDASSAEPITMSDAVLNDPEQIRTISSRVLLEKPIALTRDRLSDALSDLNEHGQTALGPALLASINIAAARPGSKVFVCTDGLANLGVGRLDADGETAAFYQQVARDAAARGVQVNVITIRGDEARLAELGVVADLTGGKVTISDPEKLDFAAATEEPIIATQVTLTLVLHSGMRFCNVFDTERVGENAIRKTLGPVTNSTTLSFEYEVTPGYDFKGLKQIPFQVQIHYTKKDGSVCTKVTTQALEITDQRDVAERAANTDVLAVNAAQQSALMVQQNRYGTTGKTVHRFDSLIKRTVHNAPQEELRQQRAHHLQAYHAITKPMLEDVGRSEQQTHTHSAPGSSSIERKSVRAQFKNDALSEQMYKNKSVSKKAFM
eukprot:comp21991_c0_seq1/m.50420 comp21991_c0_seq1/g.50420  ORF comp21991_c0_seq1/g.50420 comp21991_c0_seq1/m.50420 type:complete len:693 (-) comp21991_c0_seq1:99-2177(-)